MFKTKTSRHLAWVFPTLFLALSAILPAQQTAQDQQKAMEMYMKLGEVNENHAYLKHFVGGCWIIFKFVNIFFSFCPSVFTI